MNQKHYTVYHIPGVKVGVTTNLARRAEQLGYKRHQLQHLYSTLNVDAAAEMERTYQIKFGYPVDQIKYDRQMEIKNKLDNMKIYVSELTVTFPFNRSEASELRRELVEQGILLHVEDQNILVTEPIADWIIDNLKVSKFSNQSFVYIKSLLRFVYRLETVKEPQPIMVLEESEGEWNHKVDNTDKSEDNLIEPEFIAKTDVYRGGTNAIPAFSKVRAWASNRGIYEKGDVKTQLIKLYEEAGETSKAILNEDRKETIDGIGDMATVLINLAHLAGTSLEECLDAAWNEIKNRKGKMENGTFIKETVKSI